ncbi:hypothetical protein QE152_g9916 [Popillia japonica]|uniref:Uncharacterized protein n=1 Tax=Popillia japonica TaxID=7064 RepID=A0AAW1LWU3_POPJA
MSRTRPTSKSNNALYRLEKVGNEAVYSNEKILAFLHSVENQPRTSQTPSRTITDVDTLPVTVVSPEVVKPHPKAEPRKSTNKGRAKNKSRILADTSEKQAIEADKNKSTRKPPAIKTTSKTVKPSKLSKRNVFDTPTVVESSSESEENFDFSSDKSELNFESEIKEFNDELQFKDKELEKATSFGFLSWERYPLNAALICIERYFQVSYSSK